MRKYLILAVSLAALLFVAACSDDEPPDSASADPETTEQPPTATSTADESATPTPAETPDVSEDDSESDAESDAVTDEEPTEESEIEGPPIAEGDCFNGMITFGAGVNSATVPVDCDEPHEDEVIRVLDYPGEPDDAVPSDDDVWDFVDEHCLQHYLNFIDVEDYDESALDLWVYWWDEETWAEGDRSVVCTVRLDGSQVTGSMRGKGLSVLPADFPESAPIPDDLVLVRAGHTDDGAPLPPDFALDGSGFESDGLYIASFDFVTIDSVEAAQQELTSVISGGGWAMEWEFESSNGAAYSFSRGGERILIILTDSEPLSVAYYYYDE